MSGKTETASITEFLTTDHERLTKLWQEFLQGVKACNVSQLRTALSEFSAGLRRHIRFEEEALFPPFEERSGMRDAGPTAVMRSEHREFEAILDKLAAVTAGQDCAAIIQALEGRRAHPSALFESHDSKEENILYPMADQILSEEERRRIISRMPAA